MAKNMQHKVITIAQQKGGAGKTTLAAHLAVELARGGKRVAILDIDPQGSLTQWHNVREKRMGAGNTGLHFAALSGWKVATELSRLKNEFDYVIIDSPPHTEVDAKAAVRAADLVLIPVQPSPTDLWATKATLDLAAKENVPMRAVLNRLQPNTKMAKIAAGSLGPERLLGAHLGNRMLFASALLEGKTAGEASPNHAASQEVRAVAEAVEALFIPALKAARA